MDALLKAALAGTARGGTVPTAPDPAAALASALPDLTPERRLLLAAGAAAVYRQAGDVARGGVRPPASAPEETLRLPSRGAARLLGALLAGQHAAVLPEALDRLARAGLRLPDRLLPDALVAGERSTALRRALLPTLGERGRWLAAQNPAWAWATAPTYQPGSDLPADAEAIWEEGTPAERLAILEATRDADPARGRTWLEAAWKAEKADFRVRALPLLAAGLGPDDEPFLETALGDRSAGVRTEAARLLARLPDSALGTRLRERADTMLAYAPAAPARGLRAFARAVTGQGAPVGTLTADPPTNLDAAWQRDGIEAKPPHGVGERAWWLTQIIAHVPPAHWTAHFAATPDDLLAAARQGEWWQALLAGWAQAAVAAEDPAWARALWPFLLDYDPRERHPGLPVATLLPGLLQCLPPEERERLAEQVLEDASSATESRWVDIASLLPMPWGTKLGTRYLDTTRHRFRTRASEGYDSWTATLSTAALALPPSCFALAQQEWQLYDVNSWRAQTARRAIDDFQAIIETRRQLMEEIPL